MSMTRQNCPGSDHQPRRRLPVLPTPKWQISPYGAGVCPDPDCGKIVNMKRNHRLRTHGRMVSDTGRLES